MIRTRPIRFYLLPLAYAFLVPASFASSEPNTPDNASAPAAAPQASAAQPAAPLQLKIGDATIQPIGFMDFTAVFRSASAGTGIGTNFGSIPFNTTPTAHLTEMRLSPQNSRIGARIDANIQGAHVMGYWESDFLGNNPANVSVTSNSNTLRMRLYWVDIKRNKWEILGGQSWSLLTPGRNGISPLPADIFYSQDIDVNYNVGLTWTRNPQFRFVYHPSKTLAAGISLENAQQYIGGSGGGGVITFPANSNIAGNYANQLDSGSGGTNIPGVHPDVIAKLAFDPKIGKKHQHVEVAGLFRTFKVYNPVPNQTFMSHGAGVALNVNFELFKNFHFVSNNFYANGGGRYLFGTGPDLIVRGDGSLSPVHNAATVTGFEFNTSPNDLLYMYYGDYYFARNTAIDGTGKLVGYGYTGSPNSQNRNIQEGTIGWIRTIWKNPAYGAVSFMAQYAYYNRDPWYVAAGAPKSAHNSTVFLDLRYTLPGAAPAVE
jgi:hypothetical protein